MKAKYLLPGILSIIMTIGFVSCSDDDDEAVIPSEESIAGIWLETREDGVEDGYHYVENESTYDGQKYFTVFDIDGTYENGKVDQDGKLTYFYKGTWTLTNDDTPVITVERKGYLKNEEYDVVELTKDKLVLYIVEYSPYKWERTYTYRRINSLDEIM